ncbi:hypothetical protein [Bdellovibrio bacteriovorus]|uniref:hypothetical protein n=1 Tax=Bdellovibrio TaxID=958 RepID=UPI0035A97484
MVTTPASQRTLSGIATSLEIGEAAGLVPLIGVAGSLPLAVSAAAIWTAEISATTSFAGVFAATFVDLGLNAALLPATIPPSAEQDIKNGIKAIDGCDSRN